MGFRVVVTTPNFGKYGESAWQILKDGDCEAVLRPGLSGPELAREVAGADALIVGLEKVTREVIAAAPGLRVIAKHGAGIDNIDLEATRKHAVMVCNAPGANSEAVADLAFGLFLALARQIPAADRRVRQGEWPRLTGRLVWGKVVGIIGLGAIGRGVARRARGFNMRVLAYDVTPAGEFEARWAVERADLDTILRQADFVSLHLPLTDATRNMIAARELRLMRSTACLVNTSRGGIVDEEALARALREGWIAGAALDVFAVEPPGNTPLLSEEKAVLTPHIGANAEEAMELTSQITARNVVAALHGLRPEGLID